jgi:hypothetical protein
MTRFWTHVLTLPLLAMATACTDAKAPASQTPSSSAATAAPTNRTTPTDASQAAADSRRWPNVVVHKSPSCGCCGSWVEHMRKAGFSVEVRDTDNLEPVKKRLGIPYGKGSCHTAEVGGYFAEGHVPAEDIKRLLTERPAAKGLTLPGMPAGSPGMEMPDGRVDAYTVELVNPDGSTRPFSRHGKTGS